MVLDNLSESLKSIMRKIQNLHPRKSAGVVQMRLACGHQQLFLQQIQVCGIYRQHPRYPQWTLHPYKPYGKRI